MPNHSVASVANEFLSRARAEGLPLTHMQLQKLPYIAHGWGLAILKEPLISVTPRAWRYGPVYPSLYEALSRYRADPVDDFVRENDNDILANTRGAPIREDFSSSEKKLIDMVWKKYKGKEGIELSALTHEPDTPWFKTWHEGGRNTPIQNEIISEHYNALLEKNLSSKRHGA